MKYDLPDQEILQRYRGLYGVGDEVTFEHVKAHESLERSLTEKLLASMPEHRWEAFSNAYTELYERLPWLNRPVAPSAGIAAGISRWAHLIRIRSKIFEIGSGRAALIKFLAAQGHHCVATEITKERGSKHLPDAEGLEWHQTDGVNLSNFEPNGKYDVVISTQVLEHLHPDDLLTHLTNARAILAPSGRYIFDTPHAYSGPHDLSRVFGFDHARYMHLKEYRFTEMGELLQRAGFQNAKAVFNPRLPGKEGVVIESRAYFLYCLFWEQLVNALGVSPHTRRKLYRALRFVLAPSIIWISATK